MLRAFTAQATTSDLSAPRGEATAYVGPEIYNSLSGLGATVEQEIRLHAEQSRRVDDALGLLQTMGLDHLYGRNPFTLSGGEQAVLAVACGIFLNPTRLAIDCAFEQIDLDFRNETMKLLERPDVTTSVALADNRLGEYDFSPSEWHMIDLKSGARPAYGSLPAIQPDRASRKPVPGIVIDFEDLSFQYSKGVDVLRNAQMHLEPGAIHLLSGKNGAGKSTLAKLLAGVIRPKSGRIMFDRRVEQPWKSPGAVVAYHFQNPDVQLFATTVEEELTLGLHTSAAGERADALAPLIDQFQLRTVLAEHPLDLPFVLRKRIAMAATLAMPASWFILDEPTLGQDAGSIRTIAMMLNELARSGRGVIVVTHSDEFQRLLDEPRPLRVAGGAISTNV